MFLDMAPHKRSSAFTTVRTKKRTVSGSYRRQIMIAGAQAADRGSETVWFCRSLPWYARNGRTREISRAFKSRKQALQFAAHWQVADDHADRVLARIRMMTT